MISPQNIATGVSVTELKGQEGAVFARTFIHSIVLTIFLALIVAAQQFLFPGLIPDAAAAPAGAQDRQVAITIDDLPRGGDGGPYDFAAMRAMTEKLLRPFREQHIPVVGFVNACRHTRDSKELREILEMWLNAGADLGNHACMHKDLNEVPFDEYTADILQGEPAIREVLESRGRKLEYFRHPYLHTGKTPQVKQQLADFLGSHGYRVAPVTLDNADYEFAALYTKPEFHERAGRENLTYLESVVRYFLKLSLEVAGHEIRQILLIHASQLNADLMPQLLEMFRKRGYAFVTLAQALEDPAYQLPEAYAGGNGFSWIHRWSNTKGMPPKGEPDPADWVVKAYGDGE
jgi:peptidoglycan/xylan/chitin deacetylase (PgdA/CDA1 family)